MKFLKEKKGIIISFIIGVIIASSITVYATGYFAKDIIYKEGKNVEQALNELYNKKWYTAIDKTYLQSGSLIGNAEITENNLNSSDGLSLTGNSNYNVDESEHVTDNRWEKDIDLTNISMLTFYAKKGANHGCIYIFIDGSEVCYITYGLFGESWNGYFVDLSGYQGIHKLSIGGGYIDKTGSTSSNTQYCDIRLY